MTASVTPAENAVPAAATPASTTTAASEAITAAAAVRKVSPL